MLARLKAIACNAKTHPGFRRYFANTSWMLVEQMLRMVTGLLVGIWVARYLGPSRFGLFSYAAAFTSLFSSIAQLGLSSIVVLYLVREPTQRNVYLGTAFWLKIVGAFAMLGVIGIALELTSSDSATKLYVFIIASGVVFQAFEVIDFYFQSQILSRYVSFCKLTQLFISSLIKIYLIFVGANLLYFVLVSLVDQITLAAAFFFAYRYQKLGGFYTYFDRSVAKKLLHDGWPLILSGLVIMIYMRIDQIMIKEMLGEKEVGLYSAAVRLSEVWYFIPVIITNSLFPSIINAKKISESLYYARLQRLYTFMVWGAIGIALPMTFLSNWLVTLLYGEAYRAAGQVLTIHIWAGIFVFLGVASTKWFITEGLQKYSSINTAFGAVANVLLNFLLIPRYGIYGAAIATVMSYAISAYFMNFVFQISRKNFYRLSSSIVTYKSQHEKTQ